jgi:transcriptional regulator with XRE-family HTH domain
LEDSRITSTTPQPTLGQAIRLGRHAQGLSQEELAGLLGVDRFQVIRWERDKFVPEPHTLAAIAQVLELRASELFRIAGAAIPNDLTSLPAMLRAEYDLPLAAIADIQAHIISVAEAYRGQQHENQRLERRDT